MLSGALDALRAEHVPLPLVRALMQQVGVQGLDPCVRMCVCCPYMIWHACVGNVRTFAPVQNCECGRDELSKGGCAVGAVC